MGGRNAAPHHDLAVSIPSDQILEAFLLAAPFEEVLVRNRGPRQVRGRVAPVDDHEPVRILERQPAQERAIQDAEHRRGEPDAEAQQENGQRRLYRALREQAQAQAHVGPDHEGAIYTPSAE